MTVVSDSGPLMALAKIGELEILFRLFPKIQTPRAVHEELITAGLRLGAPDVALLQERYRSGELVVALPPDTPLLIPALLGPGEEESIRLAIELKADWLLVDDLEARQAAIANIQASGSPTRVKGTLGIVVAAHSAGQLSFSEAVGAIEGLRLREDIWISSTLYEIALQLLVR